MLSEWVTQVRPNLGCLYVWLSPYVMYRFPTLLITKTKDVNTWQKMPLLLYYFRRFRLLTSRANRRQNFTSSIVSSGQSWWWWRRQRNFRSDKVEKTENSSCEDIWKEVFDVRTFHRLSEGAFFAPSRAETSKDEWRRRKLGRPDLDEAIKGKKKERGDKLNSLFTLKKGKTTCCFKMGGVITFMASGDNCDAMPMRRKKKSLFSQRRKIILLTNERRFEA